MSGDQTIHAVSFGPFCVLRGLSARKRLTAIPLRNDCNSFAHPRPWATVVNLLF